jgi:hypothetical protein
MMEAIYSSENVIGFRHVGYEFVNRFIGREMLGKTFVTEVH